MMTFRKNLLSALSDAWTWSESLSRLCFSRECAVGSRVIRVMLMTSAIAYLPLTNASYDTLNAVIDQHWQWTLEQYPEIRLEYGDRSGNSQ